MNYLEDDYSSIPSHNESFNLRNISNSSEYIIENDSIIDNELIRRGGGGFGGRPGYRPPSPRPRPPSPRPRPGPGWNRPWRPPRYPRPYPWGYAPWAAPFYPYSPVTPVIPSTVLPPQVYVTVPSTNESIELYPANTTLDQLSKTIQSVSPNVEIKKYTDEAGNTYIKTNVTHQDKVYTATYKVNDSSNSPSLTYIGN